MLVAGVLLVAPLAYSAEELKITEQNGHVSPVRARVEFAGGGVREVVVRGTGNSGGLFQQAGYFTHVFFVRTDNGVSRRTVWLDTIAAISGLDHVRTTNAEFTIVLKNGSAFQAMFVGGTASYNCDEGKELMKPEQACAFFYTGAEGDVQDTIDLRKLVKIDFLPPARRDRAGNLMFDQWRFSPFTGEKLPLQ
jgi:hypothetical protein